MPRTTNRSLPKAPAYLDIMLQSQAHNENNDCAVRALAFAVNVDYHTAHATLKQLGRKDRTGTALVHTLAAIKTLGYAYRSVAQSTITARYPGRHCLKQRVTSNQPDRFPAAWKDGKTYLMVTDGHILCVKDGLNLDWSRGRVLPARCLYEVFPAGEEQVS